MRKFRKKFLGIAQIKPRTEYDRPACVSSLTKDFENHLTVFVSVWQGIVRDKKKNGVT